MNKQELIEKYEDELKDVQLKFGSNFKTKVYEELIEDLKQLDEPQLLKLKNVIARIEKFDLGTKAVWINEILYKLGSDYGLHKYYAGYKQGKLEGLIEREKPVVKQFVADWYEEHKDDFEYEVWDWISSKDEPEKIHSEFAFWVNDVENNPIQTLVNMHQFGYDVEKEKRYLVKMKGVDSRTKYLYYGMGSKTWLFKPELIDGLFRKGHTRKELEEAGFGEVFNSQLFEVEEAE